MNIQLVFMFDHFKMGEQKQMCIWLNLNLEFEFAFQMQYTSIKLNLSQTSIFYIMEPLIMCLCIYFRSCPPFVDDCFRYQLFRDGDHPRRRITSVNPVYRQQGKKTPLIMSIKYHIPLSLAYACLEDHLVIDCTA